MSYNFEVRRKTMCTAFWCVATALLACAFLPTLGAAIASGNKVVWGVAAVLLLATIASVAVAIKYYRLADEAYHRFLMVTQN